MGLRNKWQRFIHGDKSRAETEFLPAILEITETPPSPIGRLALWSIVSLLVVGIIWSVVGHVKETAVAEGRIIPSGQVKTIQVKNKGIIREIKVKDGDYVQEGDVLVVLDPTSTTADYDSLSKQAAYYLLDIARLEAELSGKEFTIKKEDVLNEQDLLAEQQLFASRQGQYKAERAAALATVEQKQALQAASQANYEKYQELYQIAMDKEDRLNTLLGEQAIAEFQVLEQRSQRIELQKNRDAQLESMRQAGAELNEAQKKLHSVDENYRKDVMTALVESRKQYYSLEEEIKKADENAQMATITAPCNGYVYNLAVHTVGGIVTDAQALLMVVPDGADLEFEVWADNKDIGFLRQGQEAEVKVQTYNFQKYGVVKARVKEISPNAAEDQRDMLTYEKYRLLLTKTTEDAGQTNMQLSPGMHITAEVKIKEKRIIDFFLDPFKQYVSEALRER